MPLRLQEVPGRDEPAEVARVCGTAVDICAGLGLAYPPSLGFSQWAALVLGCHLWVRDMEVIDLSTRRRIVSRHFSHSAEPGTRAVAR